MRLVKLDKRHKAYKDLGHRWAFRWHSYDAKACPKVEGIFAKMHGSQYSYKSTSVWKSGFGSLLRGHVYRPYWISFINEADATVVLLQM